MSPEVQVILKELPEVAQLVSDECWLESERRGSPVLPGDPVVQTRVADIILSGKGAEMRSRHTTSTGR